MDSIRIAFYVLVILNSIGWMIIGLPNLLIKLIFRLSAMFMLMVAAYELYEMISK